MMESSGFSFLEYTVCLARQGKRRSLAALRAIVCFRRAKESCKPEAEASNGGFYLLIIVGCHIDQSLATSFLTFSAPLRTS